MAEEEMLVMTATLGAPIEVAPAQALLWCVHITAGHVAWLHARIGETPQEQLMQPERRALIALVEDFFKAVAVGLGNLEGLHRTKVTERFNPAKAPALASSDGHTTKPKGASIRSRTTRARSSRTSTRRGADGPREADSTTARPTGLAPRGRGI
jgi:hypothetical protein